jgi:phosphopantothenoylcysteine decarboxylase/phosphopantothenate--cysteine ligase
VKKNVEVLMARGCKIIDPQWGPLASGLEGIGRMGDEQQIVDTASNLLLQDAAKKNRPLSKEVVLVTAGPTREAIDPVRFLSNRSSGKMGYEIAKAASELGADVILISGPVALSEPIGIKTILVESAKEMQKEVERHAASATVIIMAAAVCDYTPESPALQKEKKNPRSLQLKVTDDILKRLSKDKKGKILVGFSAETGNLFENASAKLKEKNLDLIVANDITLAGAGFDCDTNIVDLIDSKGGKISLPKMLKRDLAQRILEEVIKLIQVLRSK